MDLQQLITLGRFLFSNAPARLELFKEIDGRRTAKEIAGKLKRHINNVQRDIAKIRDAGLIQQKLDKEGTPIKREQYPVYEKIGLARTVSLNYFRSTGKVPQTNRSGKVSASINKRGHRAYRPQPLKLPSEQNILDICKHGEDEIYEFKGQGADVKKITREIAAMLHTRRGGMIFYGVNDDGIIEGSDVPRQKFDQSLQNSVHNTIAPPVTVKLHQKNVLGSTILVIIAPPWNKKDVYYYDGRVYIRKGTNVFVAQPDEIRKLHDGKYVV